MSSRGHRVAAKGRFGIVPAVLYEVERRNGDRLVDADTVPFTWSDRRALAFRSRRAAEDFVARVFGAGGARMSGIRVVRA